MLLREDIRYKKLLPFGHFPKVALTPRAVAGAGAGSEAIRNETGDGLTTPLPNRTGAAVRLCNALKGYPDVPRY